MVKMIVGVEGMVCGMCESHINSAIRNAFNVDSVSSSRSKRKRTSSPMPPWTKTRCAR